MDEPRISPDKDVNDTGEPIYRPPEKISEPVKPYWVWIWIAVVIVILLAWAFLFWYFSNHQAPYAAPIH
jgi:hypothetical protein